MRVKVSEPSPVELRVKLSMTLGAQFFGLLFGGGFLAVGLLFLFASLPHTDDLTLKRGGDNLIARKSQAFAGRWELNSQTAEFGPQTVATLVRHNDEGSVTFQAALQEGGRHWPFGKSRADRAEMDLLVQRLNTFLADSEAASFHSRQQTWWWFLLPFGLLGVAVGLGAIALCNHEDTWRFMHIGNEVLCRRRFLLFWRTRRWPVHEIQRAVVRQHTDRESDTFHNLRLQLRSGGSIEMSLVSHQLRDSTPLQHAADRINRFLGVQSQPLQVVDDRKPPPDPAEVQAHLDRLAATNPRLARLLGHVVSWAYQRRSPQGDSANWTRCP